ncbi:Kelch repeat-containing protein [Spirosoma aerolatum]|uniref:Kelch repeat-containing protein n=1 Tax=Spirosoma aerolatum TaxID=1211326 RepID=UPI001FE6D4A8|nr:kelch repeat-containing protein [Spirosoma aerolatum]
MKIRLLRISICVGLLILLNGCTETTSVNTTLGDWTVKSELEGVGRSGAVSFVIGNTAYVGTGQDASKNALTDFWAYDPASNAWTQKASFPGKARSEAVGFAIGTKGYLGTGADAQGNLFRDMYAYDTYANNWQRVADFSGTARRSAVGFSLYDVGFIGLGFDGSERTDLWRYNPSANIWTQRKYFSNTARVGAIAFVVNNLAYVGMGSSAGNVRNDLWQYDMDQDTWTQRQSLPESIPSSAYGVSFTVNGIGYVVPGNTTDKNVLAYDPGRDSWAVKGSFEGASRTKAVGFAIGSRGYIVTGLAGNSPLDDCWAYNPLF